MNNRLNFIIPEPELFFSYLDEKHFFHWLEEIPFVVDVVGVPGGLEVKLDGEFDQSNIGDLIAVMKRYGLNMKCLQALCTEDNQSWMKDPNKFWYTDVFGGK